MADDPKTLVSTDWLAQHLKDPDLRILDASWYLPDAGRDPKAEYDAAHIPGARFFDIDDISDARSDLPHMAPPIEKFMSRLRAMGVGDGHQTPAPPPASAAMRQSHAKGCAQAIFPAHAMCPSPNCSTTTKR